MRKLSSEYLVTYSIKNAKGEILSRKRDHTCYSILYSNGLDVNKTLILSNFLTADTSKYSRIYIKRLAKICDLKLKIIDDDTIELTGFKNVFYIKLFTTLFRILFEYYPDYKINYKDRNISFLDKYIKQKNNSGYKDMLERLIYYYQKSLMFQGGGHGITASRDQMILIKNINDLRNWNSDKYHNDMQSFFCIKN
jgi:hypothetical protein